MNRNFENQPQNQPDILRAVQVLETNLVLSGTTVAEDRNDPGRYVPTEGEFDMAAGVVEVDETDPVAPPDDGRLTKNIVYTAHVFANDRTAKTHGHPGARATFMRDMGMVEGRRRSVEYDILADGSIAKSVFDYDGTTRQQVQAEFSETEELAFIDQIAHFKKVDDLPRSQ